MVQLKSTQISVLEAHWNSYTYSGTGAVASTALPGDFQSSTITQIPEGLASSSPARGIITTAPNNFVRIVYEDNNKPIISASGQQIYGRLTHSSGTYTVTYYELSSGVETSAVLPGAGSFDIKILFPEVLYFHEVPANSNLILGLNLDVASTGSSTLNASSGGSINLQEASNNRISFDFAGSGIAVKFDTSSIGISLGQDINPFSGGNDFEIFAQDGQPGFAGGNLYLRAGAAGLAGTNKPGDIYINLYEISSFADQSSSIILVDEVDDVFNINIKYDQSLEKYINFSSLGIANGRADDVGLRLSSAKELMFNVSGSDGYFQFNLNDLSSNGFLIKLGNNTRFQVLDEEILIGDGYAQTAIKLMTTDNYGIDLYTDGLSATNPSSGHIRLNTYNYLLVSKDDSGRETSLNRTVPQLNSSGSVTLTFDRHHILSDTATASALPAATIYDIGRCIAISNRTSGALAISRDGTDTIDGNTSFDIVAGSKAVFEVVASGDWAVWG
jgi:hypothetical protein